MVAEAAGADGSVRDGEVVPTLASHRDAEFRKQPDDRRGGLALDRRRRARVEAPPRGLPGARRTREGQPLGTVEQQGGRRDEVARVLTVPAAEVAENMEAAVV